MPTPYRLTSTCPTEPPVPASTVLAVVMRVAGPVPTEVRPFALGHPEQQVTARIGDAVLYLTDRAVAAHIRQRWDATQYLAACRLPDHVSHTWLAPRPDTYPPGVALRLTTKLDITSRWAAGWANTRTPAHLRTVDRTTGGHADEVGDVGRGDR